MVVMKPVSGQVLRPCAIDPSGWLWEDVLTGTRVMVELRESTLLAENDTDRVRQAAAQAQREWAGRRQAPPPFGPPGPGGEPRLTDEEAARVFGQRYGGTWRPVQW